MFYLFINEYRIYHMQEIIFKIFNVETKVETIGLISEHLKIIHKKAVKAMRQGKNSL